MAAHMSSWTDLPKDLLETIADLLDCRIHRLRMRLVCRSWCSGVPPSCRRPPLRLPFPILKPKRSGYFKLVHSTVYCLQPLKNPTHTSNITTKCWLIMIEETEEFPKVRLKDPLSHPAYSQTLSPLFPKRLDPLDFMVSEITRVYDLQFVGDRNVFTELDHTEFLSARAEKVAVCSEGLRFAVMAIHSAGQLSIWKKGDPEWRPVVDHRHHRKYIDVVYHNGKFYAQDAYGVTISVDLSSEGTAQVRPVMGPSGEMSLLSHRGDLFLLVCRNVGDVPAGMIPDFHVYRLNEDEGGWVWARHLLGNRAIFFGEGFSFGVSDQECGGGCKMNCIYYTDTLYPRDPFVVEIQPFQNVVLFDMDDYSTEFLSRVFGSYGLFWPPPSWVLTNWHR